MNNTVTVEMNMTAIAFRRNIHTKNVLFILISIMYIKSESYFDKFII